MNELVLTNRAGKDITTSLIVAEVFGKEHKNVLRDIEYLISNTKIGALNFEPTSYTDASNRQSKMYEITKDGFSLLVMGYTGEKALQFKEKFINEFNKREALLRNDDYIIDRAMAVLAQRTKALEAQLNKEIEEKKEILQIAESRAEIVKLQQKELKEAAPKVEVYDKVLQSTSLIATSVIAKDLGMSAVSLNKLLHEKGIVYKVNNVWVLYKRYENLGYTHTKTYEYQSSNGEQKTSIQTYWTEKGRMFVHSLLNPTGAASQKQLQQATA